MFDAEVGQLQSWTAARLAWMDAALAQQASPSVGPQAYLSAGWLGPEPEAAGPKTPDAQAAVAEAAAAALAAATAAQPQQQVG